MNLRILTFFVFAMLIGFSLSAQKTPKKGYHIKAKIENYSYDTLILGYRLGSKTYVKDTAVGTDAAGFYNFKKDTLLDGGVYLILTKPDNFYFEFLIANDKEQQLTLTTVKEGGDMVRNLKIEGSDDNKVFVDYLHFLGKKSKEGEALNKRIAELDSLLKTIVPEDKKKLWADEKSKSTETLQNMGKEVEAYQKNMIAKNPSYLSSKLIQSSQNPTVPKEIEAKGQVDAYYYYKDHYFDGFDWSDKRLIRTPVLEQKIEFYLDKLTVQAPDSCIMSCEYLMGNAIKGANKDIYQFVSAHLLNKYAGSKVICMDKVYVHLGDKYYCGAMKPEWIDSAQLEKICENVNDLRYSLCGMQAQPINLTDIKTGKPVNMYDIKSRFIAVYFWDPACGNCTKNSQKLVPVYEKWKSKGFEIYGICSKSIDEVEECKKKIDEVGMKWLNTSDKNYPLAVVKKLYDVKMNPYLYLLDKDKKIMFKRIDPEQVDEILQREFDQIEKTVVKDKEKPIVVKNYSEIGGIRWDNFNSTETKDKDGNELSFAGNIEEWIALCDSNEAAYCFYNFDKNNSKIGLIYNHAAVRVVAPKGKRVPTKNDFDTLLLSLENSLCPIVLPSSCSTCLKCKEFDYDKQLDYNYKPYGWLSISKSGIVKWVENSMDMYFWTLESEKLNSTLSGLGLAQFKAASSIKTIKLSEINDIGTKPQNIKLQDFQFVEKYYGTFIRFVKE